MTTKALVFIKLAIMPKSEDVIGRDGEVQEEFVACSFKIFGWIMNYKFDIVNCNKILSSGIEASMIDQEVHQNGGSRVPIDTSGVDSPRIKFSLFQDSCVVVLFRDDAKVREREAKRAGKEVQSEVGSHDKLG
ncbi:hypothetical protein MP228_011091 [Amoeboaphelidium protococcarum]|nr:hypothetical protein MP228_011091 [Amoeboaphelidium protococcarum]